MMSAMNAHAGDEYVQQAGCKALCKLAQDDNTKTAIVGAGGICVVLAAMKACSGHTGVQHNLLEQGCMLLERIGRSDITLQKCI